MLLLLACTGPTPTPIGLPPVVPQLQVGDDVSGTLAVTGGDPVVLPDPSGRAVVLELLRSPDW